MIFQNALENKIKQNNSKENKLKIGTFNVYEWQNINDKHNFEEQCNYINKLNCDIIGLQEVIVKDRTKLSINNFKRIFSKYNIFNCTFDVEWHNKGTKFGNILLIKKNIEILENTCQIFQTKKENENRSYNKVIIKINGDKINIYNTHLEVKGIDEKFRTKQIMEIIKDNGKNKCIIIGDLNSFSKIDLEYLNKQSIYNGLMKGNDKKNLNKNLNNMTEVEKILNNKNFISTTMIINETTPITTKYKTRSDYIYLSINLLHKYYLKKSSIDKNNFISDHKSVICELEIMQIKDELDINELIDIYNTYSYRYKEFLKKEIDEIELNKKYNSYKFNKKIGEGWNARVYDINNRKDLVIKILKLTKESNGTSLLIEFFISKLLKNFNIKVGKINFIHPLYIFLIKKKYDNKYFGNKIRVLTNIQKRKLKEIFYKSIEFSKKTNIGLDLKSDNLFWDERKREWILIDCGPRIEYKPFGFSLDLLNKNDEPFELYLKIWHKNDP